MEQDTRNNPSGPINLTAPVDKIDAILDTREKTHGRFTNQALISQALKTAACRHAVSELKPHQAEALDMILHKIARILNGNPDVQDHWDDIAGYARLVSREL